MVLTIICCLYTGSESYHCSMKLLDRNKAIDTALLVYYPILMTMLSLPLDNDVHTLISIFFSYDKLTLPSGIAITLYLYPSCYIFDIDNIYIRQSPIPCQIKPPIPYPFPDQPYEISFCRLLQLICVFMSCPVVSP